jgi:hypothetical protein
MPTDRRTFLKASATALSGAAVGGCAGPGATEATLDATLLRALGGAVLPVGELGEEGVERVVSDFEAWVAGYDPVPELDHGYGTSEIRYGPGDPAPAWAAQLEALDLEARKRHGPGFAELDAESRRDLVRRQLAGADVGPGNPIAATHVAVGLLGRFYESTEATDLCYGRTIGRLTCRGTAGAPEEPRLLAGSAVPEPGA